jgi:beta-carotene 3-hydroxylase
MIALFVNSLTLVLAFIAMECIAWLTHKYIMHGAGWILHKDHHRKETDKFFERNDFFFLIFALPGIFFLYWGMQLNFNLLFWIGLGITCYGFTYFLIHDVFIHQRFKFLKKVDSFYLRAIRKAHKVHHKYLDKEHGESFGMLWVPIKYFKEALKSKSK